MRSTRTPAALALGALVWSAQASAAEPEREPEARRPTVRLGVSYAPSVLLGDGSESRAPSPLAPVAGGAHNLGGELALGGGTFRYHLGAAFSVSSAATGLRVEPATLGLAIPVLRRSRLRLEVEPTVMIANLSYLSAGSGPSALVSLSAGGDARVNLALGRLFVAASPLGFEVRYAAIDASDAKARAFTGAATYYRVRLVVGVEL